MSSFVKPYRRMAVKKRRRIIRISAIASACVVVAGAALGGWFTYYNSQNRLIYSLTDEGYAVSAGKFYKAGECLVIPDEYEGLAVVAVADSAFSGHGEIESVVLPESITSIGDGAFSGCANLSSVTVAEQSIRTAAEYYASGGELEYVGDGAFDGCTALEEFSFEYGLEHIGDRAFAGAAFTQVSLPATVEYVGGEAFFGCERLNSIIVGDRDEVPMSWAEDWRDGCNASVDFRLRVVFDYNGATDGDDMAESYVSYNGEFDFIVPERKGYAFDGWFRGETRLTDAKGSSLSAWQFNDGGIITAHWAPNINSVVFNANGGEGEMPEQKIATDESAQLSANMFTRKGYTFAGWAENTTGSVVYKDGAQYTMGAAGEYTLYAVWSVVEYTISYDLSGGNLDGVNSAVYTVESTFTLTNPVRAGYTFAGWTGTDLEKPSLSVSVVQGNVGNREYTAVWEANINKVIFHANGGEGEMPEQKIATDESAQLSANMFTRKGYTFAGWATSVDGSAIYADQSQYIMGAESSYELYAVWEANRYNVVLNAEGGVPETNNAQVAFDSYYSLPVPESEGYKFLGWYDGAEQTATAFTDDNGYSLAAWSATEDKTLYAHWQRIRFSITLNYEGAEGNDDTDFAYVWTGREYTLPVPERSNYTFGGWYTEAGGKGTLIADWQGIGVGAWSGESDIAAYALWYESTEGLIFESNEDGGYTLTGINNATVENVVIPPYYKGKPVTKISQTALQNCNNMRSLKVPSTVTEIAEGAFHGCNSLEKMTLPFVGGSRTATAYNAVLGYIFGYETVISEGNSSGSSTKFENEQYGDVKGAIWQYTCRNVFDFTGNWIGGTTLDFYKRQSYYYYIPSSLREVTITDADKISDAAFNGCTMLTSLTLNEGITVINGYAFQNCDVLTEIVIPESVVDIGSYAFAENNNLIKVTLPSGLTEIAEYLFQNCENLTYLNSDDNAIIGDAITNIERYAFDGCKNLICVENGVSYVGQWAIDCDITVITVKLREDTVGIGAQAFYDCGELTSVVMPQGVVSIGDNAFCNCSSLVSIIISSEVITVGHYAFYGCTNLTIYCEAESQPSGWNSYWNYSNCLVVWGYKGD